MYIFEQVYVYYAYSPNTYGMKLYDAAEYVDIVIEFCEMKLCLFFWHDLNLKISANLNKKKKNTLDG